MSTTEVVQKVKFDRYRLPKPPGLCTTNWYNIMLECWNEDPIKRPRFDTLFILFLNYNVLENKI